MARARIAIPRTVRRGDVIEIKTLITHPMETGFRMDSMGARIPRNIITDFSCRFRGEVVFAAKLQPGIAANPYLTFFLRVQGDGVLEFNWTGQNDFTWSEARELRVSS